MIESGLRLLLEIQPPDHLVDSIWALASPEVFVKLTVERCWSVDRYEQWLVETANTLFASVER